MTGIYLHPMTTRSSGRLNWFTLSGTRAAGSWRRVVLRRAADGTGG